MTAKEKCLPAEDLSLFCTQLAMIVRAAIPLEQGILIVEEQAGDTNARQMIASVRGALEQGVSLSKALEDAGVFPEYLIRMITVGEKAGSLDLVLEALARYYEQEYRRGQVIRRAVIYPLVSIVLMTVVVGVLVTQVLPVFRRVFADLGQASSPAMTAIHAGSIIGTAAMVLMVLFAAAVFAGWMFAKTARGGQWFASFLAHFPLTRSISAQVAAARSASVLQLLLAAGYPIEEALEFLPGLMDDPQAVARIQACRLALEDGKTLQNAIASSEMFPGSYGRMAVLGCRTGNLDEVMTQLSQHYSESAEESIDRMIGLIEPALVGILTVIVGAVLLSVMIPLIGVMSVIG